MPQAISIFFGGILQRLQCFGGVRQVTKTHFWSEVTITIPDSGVQMTTVAHFDKKWCSRVVFLLGLYAERANSRVDFVTVSCF